MQIPFQDLDKTAEKNPNQNSLEALATNFYDFSSPPLTIPSKIDTSKINPRDGIPEYFMHIVSGTGYLIVDEDSVKEYAGFSIGPSRNYYLNIVIRKTNRDGIYMGRFSPFSARQLTLFKKKR